MNKFKTAVMATSCVICLASLNMPAISQTTPASPPAVSFDAPKGIPGLKYKKVPDVPASLKAFTTKPRPPAKPVEIDVKLRQLKPQEIKVLDQLLTKKSRTLTEWVAIVGPIFKTNEALLSAIVSASVVADLSRMSKKDFDKAHTDTGMPIPGTPAEIKSQVAELKKYPRLIASLKGTVSSEPIQQNKAVIVVATEVLAPGLIIPAVLIATDFCADPLIDHRAASVSKCFDLKIRFGYPCWSWHNGWHTCHYTHNFGSLCFNAGCDAGYKISCCELTAWGSCYAQTCLAGYCAGCTGTIKAGEGMTSTSIGGGSCSYGVNAIASIECKVGGHTVYDHDIPLSPYSLQGPCPPGGPC
jgi:hypothetical protein